MEEITKREDGWYYGQVRVGTPEMAYERFREDYNRAQGRNFNGFLNRLDRRGELIHWRRSVFSVKLDCPAYGLQNTNVRSRIIGIVCTSYCRIIDFPQDVPDDVADEYLDWLMQEGNDKLKLIGRKNGLGRTNKRKNINFR